MRSLFC